MDAAEQRLLGELEDQKKATACAHTCELAHAHMHGNSYTCYNCSHHTYSGTLAGGENAIANNIYTVME